MKSVAQTYRSVLIDGLRLLGFWNEPKKSVIGISLNSIIVKNPLDPRDYGNIHYTPGIFGRK